MNRVEGNSRTFELCLSVIEAEKTLSETESVSFQKNLRVLTKCIKELSDHLPTVDEFTLQQVTS